MTILNEMHARESVLKEILQEQAVNMALSLQKAIFFRVKCLANIFEKFFRSNLNGLEAAMLHGNCY